MDDDIWTTIENDDMFILDNDLYTYIDDTSYMTQLEQVKEPSILRHNTQEKYIISLLF